MAPDFSVLPAVDRVLQQPSVQSLLQRYRRSYIVGLIRDLLAVYRRQVAAGAQNEPDMWMERLGRDLAAAVDQDADGGPQPVINATGVVLHTGLGRAPLPPAAVAAMAAAAGYCDLELDLASGARGSRLSHIEGELVAATGAEAALAVNNNAAAVLLALHALAGGRQVVVSRGQLVEIGGAFRLPDIIAASGAQIREVGTTNRTHRRDYEAAIDGDTALLLVVHPSNYRVQGFTADVQLAELAQLARQRDVPLFYDLGGGVLEDLGTWGLPHEPVVRQALADGADLVSFSGDKVLGGPQCGIVAGRRSLVDRLRGNPMMRAMRCDKTTLAGLAATLRLYRLQPRALQAALPVLAMMTTAPEVLEERVQRLADGLDEGARQRLQPRIEASQAQAGSGALPLEELPSRALSLQPRDFSVETLARRLRLGRPAVVGRVHQQRLWLDVLTVADDQVEALATAVVRASKP